LKEMAEVRTKTALILILSLATVWSVHIAAPAQEAGSAEQIQALEWRNVGPHVGVRGCAVLAHPTQRSVFFHGHSSGGIWKTEDAGQYWEPISDGQLNVGSIGAMAISLTDPDIMYAGTGEPQLRDCVSWGDGVYKTTDGGETWTNIGLAPTRNISRIRVHPENPDLVYVAAIGNPFGPSEDRGIYRSKDGGRSWEKIFFKHEQAGVIDLVMTDNDPNVLYASTFEVFRRTWGLKAGGPNSGIFKSTDGGDSWTELTRNTGLPAGDWGRVGLAHSKEKPNRISALIDSKEDNGLYRSEDGGETWTFLSNHVGITQRPFYYHHLHASPHDGDELWVLSNKLWQSLDGGTEWIQRSGTKDDFHDMVFDPQDPERMIITHDGGAMVTLNAGKTWSTPFTQPNQQIYRVNVDDQFPYNLYGNNQDLIGYKVPSASIWGGISLADVTVIGSGESGPMVPHPDDPNIVYHLAQSSFVAGGAPIQRVNLTTGQWEHVNVWPKITFGRGQDEAKYRFNWHAPIVIDPFDSEALYTAAEVVFRSRDRGNSWEVISPVLTQDDESKQKAGGSPSSLETSGQEAYNTIHRMVASTVEEGILWTGSDDGLVHVTRDAGASWQNVSPDLPQDSDVYEVEASPHEAGKAYIAVSRYRTANDFKPYLFKTSDFGKSWTSLGENFPQNEITRTIREDTVRPGLLFVGTETGIFYSPDDGASWQRMNVNLPRVAVHDIKVKDADLAIASFGRSFWVLDDISPLRQMSQETAGKKAHLYAPTTHERLGTNWWALYGGGVGGGQKNYFAQNGRMGHTFIELGVVNGDRKRKFLDAGDARPYGPIFYYTLAAGAKDVSLSILEENDTLIRTYEGDAVSKQVGLNRMIWGGMTYPDVVAVPGKPPAGIAVQAKPGTYKVKLTVDGESQVQSFELRINRNETWTQTDTDARFELWWRIRTIVAQANHEVISAMELAEKSGVGSDVAERAAAFSGALVPVGATLSAIANEPSKLISELTTVHWMLFHSEGRPTESAYAVVDELETEIAAEIAAWREFKAQKGL